MELSQSKWYQTASLAEGPNAKIEVALKKGKSPFTFRPLFKYLEAERMRARIAPITEARLEGLLAIKRMKIYQEVEIFSDVGNGVLFWLILMWDFYKNEPTNHLYAAAEMDCPASTLEALISEGRKHGSLVLEPDPDDRRRQLVFPSLMTVLNYEFVLMPTYLEARLSRRRQGGSQEVLSLIYDFHAMRNEFLPEGLRTDIEKRKETAAFRLLK